MDYEKCSNEYGFGWDLKQWIMTNVEMNVGFIDKYKAKSPHKKKNKDRK